jgi:rhodanese-related sulfurtransferase
MLFNFFKRIPKTYQDLDAEAFQEGVKSKDAVIIDVRTGGEFAGGKIKGARNIDIMSSGFEKQITNLPKDKSYYLYCRSGNRSGQACEIMGEAGFEKVYNLAGGIARWPYGTV